MEEETLGIDEGNFLETELTGESIEESAEPSTAEGSREERAEESAEPFLAEESTEVLADLEEGEGSLNESESLEAETLEGESLSEAETSAPVSVVLPNVLEVDSLAIQVSEGVFIEGLFPEGEDEEIYVPAAYASGNALSLAIPDNHVVYETAGKQLVFPSSYVDDLLLVDGYLVNMGAPVTISVNLSDSAGVSNYIISQVTFPTYGSSDYIFYVTSYGAPYRIVDRYRNSNGNLSSYTRTTSAAMTAQEITQPAWYGFFGGRMYWYIFAVALIFVLIWGRMRWTR